MASNLRVDSIVPATGTNVAIGTAGGGVNIPGVLTYEDVTNVDSVGVITARSGIRIGATGANTLLTGNSTRIDVGNHIRITGGTDHDIEFQNGSGRRKFVGGDSNELELGSYSSSNSSRDIFLQIASNGNITANTGNLVIGTAGKGIDYSAQSGAAAGMASELLDHYEEGTFTPTFGASNGTSTAGYSTQSGKYTRIGNIVHVQIRITLSSLSTNVHSHAWISGLPIASAERTATSAIVCGGMQGTGYNSFPIVGRTESGATRIELFTATNGGVTDFSTSVVSGTAYFIVQCTYRAA